MEERVEGSGSLRPPPLFLLPSDPVEAYLADGACVVAWCRAALDAVRAALEDAAAIRLNLTERDGSHSGSLKADGEPADA